MSPNASFFLSGAPYESKAERGCDPERLVNGFCYLRTQQLYVNVSTIFILLFVHARTVRAVASFSALGRVLNRSRTQNRVTQMAALAALAVAAVLNRESNSAAVKAWALQINGFDAEDAEFLVKNKVTGAGLLDGIITEINLERWGMPGEPAARIMKAVKLARGEGGSREVFRSSIQ